jgi:hypothetical protein
VSGTEEPQREITRVALRSLDGTSFVLAGSGAIREHGLVDRPTEDVDLFTSDVDRPRFSSAVDAVVLGLREAGYDGTERLLHISGRAHRGAGRTGARGRNGQLRHQGLSRAGGSFGPFGCGSDPSKSHRGDQVEAGDGCSEPW